jgi:hypothetical protein
VIQTGEKILPVVREGRKKIRQIPDVGILFARWIRAEKSCVQKTAFREKYGLTSAVCSGIVCV